MTACAHTLRAALPVCLAVAGPACGSANERPPLDAPVDDSVTTVPVDASRDAPGNPLDASSDGPVDADDGIRYDVAYINEIHMPSDIGSVQGVVLIINRSAVPISLATLSVVSFVDNTPGADWIFAEDGKASVKLQPGRAAGALNPLSTAQIVDSGLAREPIDDQTLNFTMSFAFQPAPGLKFRARAVLELEHKQVTLPFEFFITRTGPVEQITAARLSSAP
jgi:hypothetical protein